MKEFNAYEDEKYISHNSYIWKRDAEYKHLHHNTVINNDYDKQYCIINDIIENKYIKELYKNSRNEFVFLSNSLSIDEIKTIIDNKNYDRMKCYSLPDCTKDELVKLFTMLYKNDNCEYEILNNEVLNNEVLNNEVLNNDTIDNQLIHYNYVQRYTIINDSILEKENSKYLELGIEYGTTFNNICIENKTGVDPDPKITGLHIIKKTSDEFFKDNNEIFDIIFIDGMHQSEYVLRDFNNSIKCLNENGIIFFDDILPISENEQFKIPNNPVYENGILKYSSPWTGDVWKFIYYLLLNHRDTFDYELFVHTNYRGVGKFMFNQKIFIDEEQLILIESYCYIEDFKHYKNLLENIYFFKG